KAFGTASEPINDFPATATTASDTAGIIESRAAWSNPDNLMRHVCRPGAACDDCWASKAPGSTAAAALACGSKAPEDSWASSSAEIASSGCGWRIVSEPDL